MASNEEIDELRLLTDTTVEDYSNLVLSAMVDSDGINASAARLWRQKAAKYASLVDMSESGSSRSMSQLFKQATQMAEHFQGLADAEDGEPGPLRKATRVHVIERA